MKKLKIIFFGSSKFSLDILKNITNNISFEILCVFTKYEINNKNNNINLIKNFCINNNINILQPININNNIIIDIINYNCDLIIIVSYSNIIPSAIFNKILCINLHCSLLPKWKGPAPIYWALIEGDKYTGVTIIKINSNIDSGNILIKKKCKIEKNETYDTLESKLLNISNDILFEILFKILNKEKIYEVKQKKISNIKYARKINKIDAKINWNKNSIDIYNSFKAYIKWPISYFIYKNKNIKIYKMLILYVNKNKINSPGKILYIENEGMGISSNDGIIELKIIQFPNKKKITIKDLINSKSNFFKLGDFLY